MLMNLNRYFRQWHDSDLMTEDNESVARNELFDVEMVARHGKCGTVQTE